MRAWTALDKAGERRGWSNWLEEVEVSDRPNLEGQDGPEHVVLLVSPLLNNEALNALFAAAWPEHAERDWEPVVSRSLAYVGAFERGALVGFVNVAWDGGVHAFLLDTTVHPALQRRGLGSRLVRAAASVAHDHGMEWLHVDYEPHLEGFYRACGFVPSLAGLLRLGSPAAPGVPPRK